jgi:hypothetical protein
VLTVSYRGVEFWFKAGFLGEADLTRGNPDGRTMAHLFPDRHVVHDEEPCAAVASSNSTAIAPPASPVADQRQGAAGEVVPRV